MLKPTISTLVMFLSAIAAAAEPPSPAAGFVEAGANHSRLSAGNSDWSGQYLRGVWRTDAANTWNAEVVNQRKFDDRGVYFALGDTHVFDPDWYGSLTVGSSAGGFFWPRFRADGFVNRKWLERRQLITTLGFGYYRAKDVHTDRSLFLGASYYFAVPWILEGGVRANRSSPGAVRSNTGFVALTRGRDRQYYATLRYEAGREAYQLVGPGAVINDFASRTASFTWRQWVRPDWGFNLRAERYTNPFYHRNGVEAGLFMQF